MRRILDEGFFDRDALLVARDLLGTFLVREIDGAAASLMITETEAYTGPDDLACHASRGRTKRTDVMFGPPGRFYVYFVYGMHWMLNIVTREEGYPAAVLLRGVEGVSGPARLTRHFSVTGAQNGKPARRASGLWVEDRGIAIPRSRIETTPRIGVDYAKEWAEKPYRFVLHSR